MKLLLWPVPVTIGWRWVDGFMSFHSERRREMVKVGGREVVDRISQSRGSWKAGSYCIALSLIVIQDR